MRKTLAAKFLAAAFIGVLLVAAPACDDTDDEINEEDQGVGERGNPGA